MGIENIVLSAGKFILNRGFGIMTKRQGQAAVLKSGRALCDAVRNGEKLTPEVLKSIFTSKLPKGVSVPPIISTSDQLKEYISANISGKVAETLVSTADKAGAAYLSFGNKGVFYFPTTCLTTNEAYVVGATHELTHFVDFRCTSLSAKFSRFIPKPIKVFIARLFNNAQLLYAETQRKLISDLGLSSGLTGNAPAAFSKNLNSKKVISYFRRCIREQIKDFSPVDRKRFFAFLGKLNASEVSAYTNSGRIGRQFGLLGTDRIHVSELIGQYQDLYIRALKQEQEAIKIARNAGVKTVKVPKRKFRTTRMEYVLDKNGNLHRKKTRYASSRIQNPKPKCVETIQQNIKSQGKNLYEPNVSGKFILPNVKPLVSSFRANLKARKAARVRTGTPRIIIENDVPLDAA